MYFYDSHAHIGLDRLKYSRNLIYLPGDVDPAMVKEKFWFNCWKMLSRHFITLYVAQSLFAPLLCLARILPQVPHYPSSQTNQSLKIPNIVRFTLFFYRFISYVCSGLPAEEAMCRCSPKPMLFLQQYFAIHTSKQYLPAHTLCLCLKCVQKGCAFQ